MANITLGGNPIETIGLLYLTQGDNKIKYLGKEHLHTKDQKECYNSQLDWLARRVSFTY